MLPSGGLLPLFPLHVVLYPGMLLPLHVFEERYRLMMAGCLAEKQPFGVVLIKTGREVGASATPHAVGTTATIVRHEALPDGRLHVLCRGRARFRIRRLDHSHPYLAAQVEPLEDAPAPDAGPDAARLRAQAQAFLATRAGPAASPLPEDPAALSFALPPRLGLPLAEQQALLECLDLPERLRQLRQLLARERHLGRRVGPTRAASPGSLDWPSRN